MLAAQVRIVQLITAYRRLGHLAANTDPLGRKRDLVIEELEPSHWGLLESDMDRRFSTAAINGPSTMTLRELISFLQDTYTRTIGCEFMHINNVGAKRWLQMRCEKTRNFCELDRETQLFILQQLGAAEAFEEFLQIKFLGAKRFSLEGAESLLPLLWMIIEETTQRGVREVVMGMAHRGRLNVLANLGSKNRITIFEEFSDTNAESYVGRGDVKYHLGCRNTITTRQGHELDFTLTFNPSHLEAINPVVEGVARARQDVLGEQGQAEVLPILIHGDAAFIGQGLVAETLNLMRLPGYGTGGTIHIVVNNQIGFTTDPVDSRSSIYCSDIAKMLDVPIFHVNGEDPEAVVQVSRIAAEYRQKFKQDVVIDMYAFRRYGHNEADEPRFTQPMMYDVIAKHPDVHVIYGQRLSQRGLVSIEEVTEISKRQKELLGNELEILKKRTNPKVPTSVEQVDLQQLDSFYVWDAQVPEAETRISDEVFEHVMKGLNTWPDGFKAHRVLQRLRDSRLGMLKGEPSIDWGTGELLAYGALVLEGHPVRVSGQDAQRGTFSHRHAVLHDQNNGATYFPLEHLSPEQAKIEIINSPLSEAAALGFEFGYSLSRPKMLVAWEAQFGDFANGAQVIIDQFISASEDKWEQRAPLVMLLPHGYEGQGPEHSSARLERYLQLCADDNIQVVNLTTPAQIFHALRRQILRDFNKPLIVMTPKSLLRHRKATSSREDFTRGRFQRVIPDTSELAVGAKLAIVCSGKIYYDLVTRRDNTGERVAVVRLEQLHPFPKAEFSAALTGALPNLEEIVWCQEEPQNMGAFHYLLPRILEMFGSGPRFRWVHRNASASPATGSPRAHRLEQADIVQRAFGTPAPALL